MLKNSIGIINGSVSVKERQQIIDSFESAPPGTVLAAQIEAGGVGLNIQAASVVIICEPQWKPSTENQAISRAYRMGQTRDVLVYRLLCSNTIDEKITELLTRKQHEFDVYADESIAGKQDLAKLKETVQIDPKEQKRLLLQERDRILEKRKNSTEHKSTEE
jgi:SNF2 family DNA or RNA helicase